MAKSIVINDRIIVEDEVAYAVDHTVFSNQYYVRRKRRRGYDADSVRLKGKMAPILKQISNSNFIRFCDDILDARFQDEANNIFTKLEAGEYGHYSKEIKSRKSKKGDSKNSNLISSLYRDL